MLGTIEATKSEQGARHLDRRVGVFMLTQTEVEQTHELKERDVHVDRLGWGATIGNGAPCKTSTTLVVDGFGHGTGSRRNVPKPKAFALPRLEDSRRSFARTGTRPIESNNGLYGMGVGYPP